jgi:nucleotide-binding universal stress UspA family protein
MPKTLVIPLDGSERAERALPVAQELARHFEGCQLVAVTTAWHGRVEEPRGYLDKLSDLHPGLRVELIDDRDAPQAISLIAGSEPDAVVCMTTHGRGRIGATLVGSIAEEVLREIDVPTVLVGPHCDVEQCHEPRPLLACLDGSTESLAILPVAARWAKDLGADLLLTTVFHPLDVPSAKDPEGQFEEALKSLGADASSVHLRPRWSSYPPGDLLDLARELSASLVAMTTHTRRGVARLALGSVTMAVAHDSVCPLLVTRPG